MFTAPSAPSTPSTSSALLQPGLSRRSARPMLCLLTALCLAGAFTSAQAQTAGSATAHPAPAANALAVRADGIWIDVRTPQEYAQGHLQDTLLLPAETIAQRIADVVPDKAARLHLYCRSGRRAQQARQVLLDLGYTQVTNHGGYEDLLKQGLR